MQRELGSGGGRGPAEENALTTLGWHSRPPFDVLRTSLKAFFLREMKNRFTQFRLGYFWAVFEPVSQVLIMLAIHGLLLGHRHNLYGENPVLFFVLGVIPFLMFQHGVDRCIGAIEGGGGLYNYRQIKPIDIILVRVAIEFLVYGATFALFVFVTAAIGIPLTIHDPLKFVSLVVLLWLLAAGTGLFFSVMAMLYQDSRRVMALFMRIMFFISGVFFALDAVPVKDQIYLTWNPVLHIIDGLKDAAFAGYHSPGDPAYALLVAVAMCFLGLAAYRRNLYRLM